MSEHLEIFKDVVAIYDKMTGTLTIESGTEQLARFYVREED